MSHKRICASPSRRKPTAEAPFIILSCNMVGFPMPPKPRPMNRIDACWAYWPCFATTASLHKTPVLQSFTMPHFGADATVYDAAQNLSSWRASGDSVSLLGATDDNTLGVVVLVLELVRAALHGHVRPRSSALTAYFEAARAHALQVRCHRHQRVLPANRTADHQLNAASPRAPTLRLRSGTHGTSASTVRRRTSP